MMLGTAETWAVPTLAGTHDGVQVWENGPLCTKTTVGATCESGFSAFVAGSR